MSEDPQYVVIVQEPGKPPQAQVLCESWLWLSLQQAMDLPRVRSIKVYRLGEQLISFDQTERSKGHA